MTQIAQFVRNSVRRRMAQDAAMLAMTSYGGAALGLIANVVAIRLLAPEEFGRAALIMSYPTLLWSFASFKPASVVTRYLARYRAAGQQQWVLAVCRLGFGLDLLSALVVVAIVAASGWWVSDALLGLSDAAWPMLAYTASLPLAALAGTSQAVLTTWESFWLLSLFQLLERLLMLGLAAALLMAGSGAMGLVAATAIAPAIVGVLTTVAATRILARAGQWAWWRSTGVALKGLQREFTILFGWNYLLVTLTGVVVQLPLLLLGRLRGPEQAGYYRLGLTLMSTGAYLEQALARIAYPALAARWGAGDPASVGPLLRRWTLQLGLPAAAAVLLAATALPLVVPPIFGAEYGSMVAGAQVLMLAVALRTLCFWLNPLYYAAGNLGRFTRAYGIYALAVVVGCWLLAPNWGFLGAATVIAGGYALLMAALIVLALRTPAAYVAPAIPSEDQ